MPRQDEAAGCCQLLTFITFKILKRENLKDVLHDFKTPLTSILGYVELLRENRDRKSREYFLNIIEEESLANNKKDRYK